MSSYKSSKIKLFLLVFTGSLAVLTGLTIGTLPKTAHAQALAAGCVAGGSYITSGVGGFNPATLDMSTASVDGITGNIKLDTGAAALDINNIVVPFEQSISSVFLLEGAGYLSDIGWFVKQEAETKLGFPIVGTLDFNDLVAAGVTLNYLFRTVEDDQETDPPSVCCGGGNGILDTFYDDNDNFLGTSGGLTEAVLTGWGFAPDSSAISGFVATGEVDPRDMRKQMGTVAAGTEIVYFLHADGNIADTYYSKDGWSADTWAPTDANKDTATLKFDLSIEAPEQGGPPTVFDFMTIPTTVTQGFMPTAARDRLGNPDGKGAYPANGYFDVNLIGEITKSVVLGNKYNHFLVVAPPADPFKWVIGVEDLIGGGDADFNDMVFMIERETGGVAQLKSANALSPADPAAYITSVTVNVTDKMPCGGDTQIRYHLSIDDGTNWVEITEWDVVRMPDSNGILRNDWTYGNPEDTYREVTINFSEMGLTGRELIWKTELVSENDACVPEVVSIDMTYNAALNREFSRSSPIVLGNVIYSASFETPDAAWIDEDLRGHFRSERLYDPLAPAAGFAVLENWDAGVVLTAGNPSLRRVITPNITLNLVSNEVIATGDGIATVFTGTLATAPIVHSTIQITDSVEFFTDSGNTSLDGTLTGTGTIDRFTGDFTITFNSPPGVAADILANYTAYTTAALMDDFLTGAVDGNDLALDNSQITDDTGTRYVYDFNGDSLYDAADTTWLKNWVAGYRDGALAKKEWVLSAIDHSAPAIAGSVGLTAWYFGTDVTDAQRDSFDIFRCQQRQRDTVAYIGSRMGMLHAFDAGKFRPFYFEESTFAGACNTANLESFRDSINPGLCLSPGNDPTYPGPGLTCASGGALGMIINRGYYEWSGGAPDYGTGEELWAAVPSDQLAKLKNNKMSGTDRAFVDASPAVANVEFSDGSWHTVVITAEGNGGDHIFAMDVTDPANPTFLWEFADPDLYRSRSSPSVAVIGQIVTTTGMKWVAFFVSGVNKDPAKYPAIYMTDIETGKELAHIELDTEAGGLGGTPSGQPAVLDSDGNGYSDKLYIGTDKGYLYKVSIPDKPNSSGSISVCTFFDAGQPIYASPSALLKNTINSAGELEFRTVVFVGTGDSPYHVDTGNTDQYYFYAINDNDSVGSCGAGTQLWQYKLPKGHRIFASAFATAEQVYFGTTAADTEDPCAPPTAAASAAGEELGKLFVLDFDTAGGDPIVLHEEAIGNVTTTPVVADEHLFVKSGDGTLRGYGGNTFQNKTKQGGISEATVKSWREVTQ